MTYEHCAIEGFFGEYRWLSNFWPARVMLGDLSFDTVEHAFQAAKTLDRRERQYIGRAPTPDKARRWGREKIVVRGDWHTVKLGVMEDLVRQKFTKHPTLKGLLLATGDEDIIEVNSWGDYYWGVAKTHAGLVGDNHLGKIIMKVRGELR